MATHRKETASIRDLPPVGLMSANIAAAYRDASAKDAEQGHAWYERARALAADLGVGERRGAYLIAALSPRTPWARNETLARLAAAGTFPLPTTRSAERAARRVLALPETADLDTFDRAVSKDGPKVRAFARAILGDLSAVCIDVHALRVALGAPLDSAPAHPTTAAYRIVAAAYRRAAWLLDVPPTYVQATTWVALRGSAA